MIAFLTSRLGIGLIGIAGIVLMYVGWTVQVTNLRAEVTAEQFRTAQVQKGWDDYKLQVEQTISNNALQHAAELRAALDQQEALAAQADRLRIQANVATRQRNEASQALLKALNDAPKTDASPLDPGSRDFYKRLRDIQTARAAGNPTSPN